MKTVHIIGDSISIQYGPYLAKYLVPYFHYSRKEGDFGNMDVPEGANGGDSSMVLDYLRKCVAEQLSWDLLVINCGLHDIKRYDENCQINTIEYKRNLDQIFEHAQELCDQTIWMRTTLVIEEIHNSRMSEFKRFNKDVEKYNEIADEVADSKGAQIIDLNTFCQSLGGREIYQDHAHFLVETQRLQAAFIAGHIFSTVHFLKK